MGLRVEQVEMNARIERFLIETPAGSPGGVQVRDASPDLGAIPEALWFVAYDGDALVGAYALLPVPFGWWRCHLTVAPSHREEATLALVEAVAAFVPPSDSVAGSCEEGHQVLRSGLERVGYGCEGSAEVIAWSRKRADPDVGPSQPHEHDRIHEYLAARGVHGWSPPAAEGFLVLRSEGEVVAGTTLRPLSWHVDSLGPGSGFTLPLLRLLGLRLDPLRFGAFVGTFGETQHVERLWQGVLHHAGIPVALVGGDPKDPRWAAWTRLSRGRIGRLIGTSAQLVYTRGEVPTPLDWGEGFLR